MKSFFEILSNEFSELLDLGLIIERNLISNPDKAIIQSRILAEKLLNEVINREEGQAYLQSYKQYEKIKILNKEGILDFDVTDAFNDIRLTGNKIAHGNYNEGPIDSLRVHKKIYIIIKWFYESYGKDYYKNIQPYKLPDFNESKKQIDLASVDELIKMRVDDYIKIIEKNYKIEEIGIERDLNAKKEDIEIDEKIMQVLGYEYKDEILQEEESVINDCLSLKKFIYNEEKTDYEYIYKKLNGSYLLNELSKLSESSQEAVESCSNMSIFKKYLHVERSIQSEFIELLKEAVESEESELIILCGSVGDGKSHLLAYINENLQNLYNKFEIHNDATESFDPEKTEIETLEEILEAFSDENIKKSKKKQILAINLGVLNNFLASDIDKKKFTRLNDFIKLSKVFYQDNINSKCSSDNFKLVSFGNYNIYELSENNFKSTYIESLLNKVIDENENNPFYNAYIKDKNLNLSNPVIENYEILKLQGVIERISKLIIKIMVKNKKILGTRELLNFIYELLVPASIEELKLDISDIEYIKLLLPNLLFASKDRGTVLKLISKEDVLNIRDEILDEILIKLNITSNIREILFEYTDENIKDMLTFERWDIKDILQLPENLKTNLVSSLLRMLFILGNEKIFNIFIDEKFSNFMNYLYYFNTGNLKLYKAMFEEVKSAIFKWKHSEDNEKIYLNEKLKDFKISEKLDLKANKFGSLEKSDELFLERFKDNINIAFEVKEKGYESMEIDYQLYEKIVEVNKGYYVSKNDKEDAIIFVEFIDKLLNLGSMDNELFINDKREGEIFKLTFEEDDFDGEIFKFERV